LDLFVVEQAMTIILGELMKQLTSGYPEMIAIVIAKVIARSALTKLGRYFPKFEAIICNGAFLTWC
jgi:hypothetical protein